MYYEFQMSANQTAGLIGRFGQSSFTSVSSYAQSKDGGVQSSKPSKFFKSRNAELSESQVEGLCGIDEEPGESEDTLTASDIATPAKANTTINDGNLVVAVRVRPLVECEGCIDIDGSQIIVGGEKIFNYDHVLDSEVDQSKLYESLVFDQVERVLEGYNATVFAYGQTGTGKTFTMGTSNSMLTLNNESRGVIPRVLQQVLESKQAKEEHMTIKVSFCDILMEQVFDLLNPSGSKVPLQVREVQDVFKVVQLTEVDVSTVSDALDLLTKGSKFRSTESTSMNLNSSRSHAIFTVTLVSADLEGNTITRKLTLVDLAGSESSNRTQAVGNRFTEGIGINKGLSVLSRVITAIGSKKTVYIPYRDSALTKVLKECLLPHCLITMISCVSSSKSDIYETVNTLRFSNQAKQLRIKPLPAHLLDSCRASVAKKRANVLGIPSFPRQINQTIHTMTPSSLSKTSSGFKRTLNATIGTPGKRAKGENNSRVFATPQTSRAITSTTSKSNFRPDMNICDLSGVSMIEPPDEPASSASSSSTVLLGDLSTIISPLMRAVRQNMQQEFDKFKADFIKNGHQPTKTPVKLAKSRMTSSPNRALADLLNSSKDATEDSDANDTTVISTSLSSPSRENIVLGAGITFPANRSIQKTRSVVESASPDLASRKISALPASTQKNHVSKSPTIEEMERTLGINPDSPSTIMFTTTTTSKDRTSISKPRRTTRRTTMLAAELNQTLREIQNDPAGRRRSMRVAAQGKYYGSPSTKVVDENEAPKGSHPLLETSNWTKVDPTRQAKHNRTLLDVINTGNTRLLAVS